MDAYDYWEEKFKAWPQMEVYIGDYLQKNASPEDLDLEIKSVTYIKLKEDIPLKERLRRADKPSCQIGHPIQETIIISIHVNES